MTTYIILVKFKGKSTTIIPDDLEVCRGKHDIQWRLACDSDPVPFRKMPALHNDDHPFKDFNVTKTMITCTDYNETDAAAGLFTYKLDRDDNGAKITFSRARDGVPKPGRPYIINRPD